MAAGQALFADEMLQRGCSEHPPRKSQTADDGAPVSFLREIARLDRRHIVRPVRLDLDIAARQGPHLPAPALRPGVSLSSPICPPLNLPGAVHCISGVTGSSSTLTEAAA